MPASSLAVELPIDLLELSFFVLADPTVLALAASITNSFYVPLEGSEEGRIGVREEEGHCWGALPREWRTYFVSRASSERQDLLRDLADGTVQEDFPASLRKYMHSCRQLALDRTQSDVPLLSHPLSSLAKRRTPTSSAAPLPPKSSQVKKRPANNSSAGLGPKKAHEVEQFCRLVQAMLADDATAPTHVIDVGSGRAHLSRKLAAPPLGLHVLALDWSASQLAGAEKLDVIHAPLPTHDGDAVGSLTHRISSLDADGIENVMATWPPEGGAMLVALHACGDLTVDSLKAFVRTRGSAHDPKIRKLVGIGCCYNLLTPETFPLSAHLDALPTPPLLLTRDHLLLTAQAPPTWHLSPLSIEALSTSIHKLAYRARFSAEVEACGLVQPKCGRIGNSTNYLDYRRKALAKTALDDCDIPPVRFGAGDDEEQDWQDGLFQLQVYWTLKSMVGPVIESLLLLDRYAFLVEQLEAAGAAESTEDPEDPRRVELVNLFDQATGSLRNVALVVR